MRNEGRNLRPWLRDTRSSHSAGVDPLTMDPKLRFILLVLLLATVAFGAWMAWSAFKPRLRYCLACSRDRGERGQRGLAKRSNLIPPCSEQGESESLLPDVKILYADRYELKGTKLAFERVLLQLEPKMARSSSLGCRYSVHVVAMPRVDAPGFSRATGRLRRHFYVRER